MYFNHDFMPVWKFFFFSKRCIQNHSGLSFFHSCSRLIVMARTAGKTLVRSILLTATSLETSTFCHHHHSDQSLNPPLHHSFLQLHLICCAGTGSCLIKPLTVSPCCVSATTRFLTILSPLQLSDSFCRLPFDDNPYHYQ